MVCLFVFAFWVPRLKWAYIAVSLAKDVKCILVGVDFTSLTIAWPPGRDIVLIRKPLAWWFVLTTSNLIQSILI